MSMKWYDYEMDKDDKAMTSLRNDMNRICIWKQ